MATNLRSILIIFISGIIFFLGWDIVENYFLNSPQPEDIEFEMIDIKYEPAEIEEIILRDENN